MTITTAVKRCYTIVACISEQCLFKNQQEVLGFQRRWQLLIVNKKTLLCSASSFVYYMYIGRGAVIDEHMSLAVNSISFPWQRSISTKCYVFFQKKIIHIVKFNVYCKVQGNTDSFTQMYTKMFFYTKGFDNKSLLSQVTYKFSPLFY